jgi:hypothetical protein
MKLDTQYSLGASIKYQFTHTCVTVGKYKFLIHISIQTCHGVVGLVLAQ